MLNFIVQLAHRHLPGFSPDLDMPVFLDETEIERSVVEILKVEHGPAAAIAQRVRSNSRHVLLAAVMRSRTPGTVRSIFRRDQRGRHVYSDDQAHRIIALPVTMDAIVLLDQMILSMPQRFFIQRTTVTSRLLEPLFARYRNVEFLDVFEMARQKAGEVPHPSIWVTFPDHTFGSGASNETATLFGQDFLFQPIEPLLRLKHKASLFRYSRTAAQGLEMFEIAGAASDAAAQKVTAVIAWLAMGIERSITESPGEYLAWPFLVRKSKRRFAALHDLYVHLISGYLRSWRLADPRSAAKIDALLAVVETQQNLQLASPRVQAADKVVAA